MSYPVSVIVEPPLTDRNRLTVALRILLVIPHLILVGGIGFGAARSGSADSSMYYGETGLLGAIAALLAIVSWFTIVLVGRHFPGIRQYTAFYVRWRVRALAYLMLLVDQYPPFGDSAYPASMTFADPVADPAVRRNRLTVALRLLLGIPHFFMLALLVVAWWFTAIVAWLLIVATGSYPKGLYDFGVGVLQWYTRVEMYMLLMIDDYPPFALS